MLFLTGSCTEPFVAHSSHIRWKIRSRLLSIPRLTSAHARPLEYSNVFNFVSFNFPFHRITTSLDTRARWCGWNTGKLCVLSFSPVTLHPSLEDRSRGCCGTSIRQTAGWVWSYLSSVRLNVVLSCLFVRCIRVALVWICFHAIGLVHCRSVSLIYYNRTSTERVHGCLHLTTRMCTIIHAHIWMHLSLRTCADMDATF